MKSNEEILVAIVELKAIRPKVIPKTAFGDDNLEALDAQIQVLEELMDIDDIWDEWWEEEAEEYVRHSALEADKWLNNQEDTPGESLASQWPLKRH